MKKVILVLSVILALCMLVTVFVACNKDNDSSQQIVEETPEEVKLSAPHIFVDDEGTVSWSSIGFAEEYGYIINNGAEVKVKLSPIASLKLNVNDTIKVKAYATKDINTVDGKKYCYTDSDTAEVTYTGEEIY